ncbi:hypothetical protein C8N26_1977 [Tenacibaculum lutimaris]|uniref:Uncharacterized protein n=1 Tax=Tenacibaculum lutimaris TaxID=285258 RepID=A0A420E0Z9_9FLAO|nr:hypothetical protein [Tenacibaculum lutimaris]RKF03587.1 hypothetical protein C8N26_1977 [Tenacibaculum lutimaris]
MWDLDYNTFFEDCDEVFKDFLAKYGFKDIGGDEEEYEKFYKSEHWILEINMLSNFPWIGVSSNFLSLSRIYTKPSLIDKFIENMSISKFSPNSFESRINKNDYKGEMLYIRENLETFYKPILTGEFTYEDYKKFEALLGEDV